jgi:hypothetical protein
MTAWSCQGGQESLGRRPDPPVRHPGVAYRAFPACTDSRQPPRATEADAVPVVMALAVVQRLQSGYAGEPSKNPLSFLIRLRICFKMERIFTWIVNGETPSMGRVYPPSRTHRKVARAGNRRSTTKL